MISTEAYIRSRGGKCQRVNKAGDSCQKIYISFIEAHEQFGLSRVNSLLIDDGKGILNSCFRGAQRPKTNLVVHPCILPLTNNPSTISLKWLVFCSQGTRASDARLRTSYRPYGRRFSESSAAKNDPCHSRREWCAVHV
jgi:hypothetical protein